MKVQASNQVNFKSSFFREPSLVHRVTDSGAINRNFDRMAAGWRLQRRYENRLAKVDKLIPRKGWFSRTLNSIVKAFIPPPQEAKMEPIERTVDFREQWRKKYQPGRFYADAAAPTVSAEARDRDTMGILSRW